MGQWVGGSVVGLSVGKGLVVGGLVFAGSVVGGFNIILLFWGESQSIFEKYEKYFSFT